VAKGTVVSVIGVTTNRWRTGHDASIESARWGPERRRSRMAEKRIQPKAAKAETAKSTTAAAGVEKKSLRKLAKKKSNKRVAKRTRAL
jgi:hypothetical protein